MSGDAHALVLLALLASAHDGGPPRDVERGGRVGRLASAISNAVLDGLDPDLVVDRIDVDGVVSRIDIGALVARIDPNDVVRRTDVDALLDQVDVDRLLDRVDVNRLLDRVDVDRLLDRVDVDRLLDRVDVEALLQRARVPELVAESTGQVAGSALDLVRQQVVAVDVVLMRLLVAGLLRRDVAALPAGPPRLVGDARGEVPTPEIGGDAVAARFEVGGHFAGPASRLLAHAGDVALATSSFTAISAGAVYVLGVVFGLDVAPGRTGPVWLALLVCWMFAYWWISTAIVGRTPAMTVLGLRILARDGQALRQRGALLRTLVLPVSTGFFGLGFLGILLDRERRALHDLAGGAVVVYDWGGRTARMPSPLGRFLSRHGAGPGDDV